MKTILTPNTSPDRKRGLYLRVPIKPVPPTEQNFSSWAATWNEGRDPETVLAIAERRARRVLEGEGIRPVKRVPKKGTVRSIPTVGTVVESKPLSERAEVAVSVLWSAFMAREAMKTGDLAKAVVEAIGVGTLSERMLVLPFEAEVVRLASNRSKGGKARAEKFAARKAQLAGAVERLVSGGLPISKAAARVAAEHEKKGQRIDPKTAENAYRAAFRPAPR